MFSILKFDKYYGEGIFISIDKDCLIFHHGLNNSTFRRKFKIITNNVRIEWNSSSWFVEILGQQTLRH